MGSPDSQAMRVLVHAPTGRDGGATVDVLHRGNIQAEICDDLDALLEAMDGGVGAVFIAEEGLFGKDLTRLSQWVGNQPPWSDLPFVVLTSRHDQDVAAKLRERIIETLRNVSLLERPVQSITLWSAMQAALRARGRQYELCALIEERTQAAQELETLVEARTAELAEANALLVQHYAEKEKVEDTLRQAQKIEAIGQLTGGIAHDFNNLLMVITGGFSLLDRTHAPDRRRRIVDGMRHAAERGAALCRQLLAFARRKPLTAQPVDLALQIGEMRELLDRTLRGDVHVETRFAPGLWPASIDPAELELVLLNLCINARDAMPSGGTITIVADNAPQVAMGDLNGDFVRLSIVDTGTGMSLEVLEKAFDPFFTTKEVGSGSGLGLPQVHGFAKQSGGSVTIESTLGVGTTITLLLPRSLELPSDLRHRPSDIGAGQDRKCSRGSMLLVEDDDEVAALVIEMLEELGWEVTRVARPDAALGALANGREIDLVLSDVMMPGSMNGVELAREIRRRRPLLPIVLTSGYSEAVTRDARAEGIELLPKPYHLQELDAALSRASACRTAGAAACIPVS